MSRLRARLSYANVMSTAAVFLAIGGGVAFAVIQGSGKAVFSGEKGLPTVGFVKVAGVPGVGKVLGHCNGVNNTIRFKNTSGTKLTVTSFNQETGATTGPGILDDGETDDWIAGSDTTRYHVFKFNDSGRPMADFAVTSVAEGACEGGTGMFVTGLSSD
jgi:hypothetical protein